MCSNFMLASVLPEFYYIFTISHIWSFLLKKRGYWAYITSLTDIILKNRVYMCMYKYALSVSSSLHNWCYDTLTKRGKKICCHSQQLVFDIVGFAVIAIVYVYLLICVYKCGKRWTYSLFSVSFPIEMWFLLLQIRHTVTMFSSVCSGDFRSMRFQEIEIQTTKIINRPISTFSA